MAKDEWTTVTRELSVALATPAVPTWCAIIETWEDDGEEFAHCSIEPVLAIRSVVRQVWSIRDPNANDGLTPTLMARHGWRLTSQFTVNEPVFLDSQDAELGLMTRDECRNFGLCAKVLLFTSPDGRPPVHVGRQIARELDDLNREIKARPKSKTGDN